MNVGIGRMCENEEEQEEIIKPSLFVYTLECTRPCADGERAIYMYSRNKGVVSERWYEYMTYTPNIPFENAREGRESSREREAKKK